MPLTEAARKKILIASGWLMVLLGAIGLLLPIMPTTPFLIVAAYFFSKSSPKLHRWARQHRHFGPPLRDWEDHRVIRPKAKMVSTAAIVVSFGISSTVLWGRSYLSFGLIGTAAIVLLFIWTRNSRKKSERS